jgi:hypothetical protein
MELVPINSPSKHYERSPLLGRLIVKLRRILSPQAELSRTSRTFSALTALPRLLLCAEPAGLSCSPSKLKAELVALCGDSWGECLGAIPGLPGEAGPGAPTEPERSLAAPSKPCVMNEERGSLMSMGERNGDTVAFACLVLSFSSSTKTSGPS